MVKRIKDEKQVVSGFLDAGRDAEFAQLLQRSQDGDKQAYESFLNQISQVLRAYLSRRLDTIDLVEDVLQETLITIHQSRHTFIKGRPVGPWLFTICKHKMIDYLRKLKRLQKKETLMPEHFDWGNAHVQVGRESELGVRIREILEQLPEKQKMIIKLLKFKNMSVMEVARETGMSESAVKVTAFRGYEALRRILGVNR